MKIFVSSRLRELSIERKTAIETIHFAGHTPIYIETEPAVKDQTARAAMLSLIRSADAFLSIHYLSEGTSSTILNHMTPIEFELSQFLQDRKGAPVLLFRRVADDITPSAPMVHWFENVASELRVPIVSFDSPVGFHILLKKKLTSFRQSPDDARPDLFSIHYAGPDFKGLISTLAETLYVSFQLNIDFIAHSALGGYATVRLSCSSTTRSRLTCVNIETTLGRALEEKLLGDRRNVSAKSVSARSPFKLMVNFADAREERSDLELEARMIDAPGQLNALCSALTEMSFHIDYLTQNVAPQEYPRQTLITLRLSRRAPTDVGEVESTLQYLSGLRALSLRPLSVAGGKGKSHGPFRRAMVSLPGGSPRARMASKLDITSPSEPAQETRLVIPSTGSQNRLAVFLCHASQDKPRVRKLHAKLTADGFRPWIDENDLVAGQNWPVEIQRAVRHSHAVLICLSPISVTKSGPLQQEIKTALEVQDEQAEGMIFIVPVLLAKCEVPHALKQLQYVELFKPNGYRRLREALEMRAEQMQQVWLTRPKR